MNYLKSTLKRWFPEQVDGYRLYRYLVLNRTSYLHTTGWLASLRSNQPVGAEGEPVPWMNYSVVQFLESRIPKDAILFEYGSGNSTKYWAKRVSKVVSLEYDETWFSRVNQGKPNNASIEFCAQDRDGAYCRHIAKSGAHYDVVVVDGRDRVNCVKQAAGCLTPRASSCLTIPIVKST
jgi:hypothetical protein